MYLQKEPVGEWTVANIIDNDREQWAEFHGFLFSSKWIDWNLSNDGEKTVEK